MLRRFSLDAFRFLFQHIIIVVDLLFGNNCPHYIDIVSIQYISNSRYFRHAHFIHTNAIVGVGKRGEY